MLGMARAGGGQQYYGQTAADLFDGFDEELALLEAMLLRRLRLSVVPAPGVVVEALGQVNRLDDGRFVLSDLAWAAESWLMLRLHVGGLTSNDPAKALLDPTQDRQRALVSVTLQAEDMHGASRTLHSPVLSVPVLDASACKDLPLEPVVAQRLQELQFGDAAAEVRLLLLARRRLLAAKRKLKRDGIRRGQPPLAARQAGAAARADRARCRDVGQGAAFLRAAACRRGWPRTAQFQYSDLEVQNDEIPAYLRRKVAEGTGRDRT